MIASIGLFICLVVALTLCKKKQPWNFGRFIKAIFCSTVAAFGIMMWAGTA